MSESSTGKRGAFPSIYDAAVVGAGPAGSAAAATLAQRGRSVLLLEKERFPRHKVCGALLSADAMPLLDRLGARGPIAACAPESIREGAIHLPHGPSISFRLPAPALGISRLLFDDLLARRARGEGAHVRFGVRVVSVTRSDGLFRVGIASLSGQEEVLARSVVGAWGRWDALDRALDRDFLRLGRRFFGWSRDFRGGASGLAGRVALYLFRGGYCGLSRVEGGAFNLAGVISEKAKSATSGWEAVLLRSRAENSALDRDLAGLEPGPVGFLGTGPVFFTSKPAAEHGVLMAGDAAGVLDPFSGEGQSAALAAGILAAETLDAAFSGLIPLGQVADAYERAWRSRFARRFGWSALFRRLMLHPLAATFAARIAGNRLVTVAVRSLHPEERVAS